MPIHNDHTQLILNAINLSQEDKLEIEALPFFDGNSHITKILNNDYDVLVFSVLMDYMQNLYRHKEKGVLVPFGGYQMNQLTDKEQHKEIINRFQKRNITGFSEGFLKEFSEKYECLGQESPEIFGENLKKIRNTIDENIPIVFLNGSEVKNINANEMGCTERHCLMNKVLLDFISSSKNCYLLDVRKYVKETSDTTDNIRHYHRAIYMEIADELVNLLNCFGVKANINIIHKIRFNYNRCKQMAISFLRRITRFCRRKRE